MANVASIFKLLFLTVISAFLLSACGGGSSSSGGDVSNPNDGDYAGTFTLSSSGALGSSSFSDSSSFGFSIRNNIVTSFSFNGSTTAVSFPVTNNAFVFGDSSSVMNMEDVNGETCTILIQITVNLFQGTANGSNTETQNCIVQGTSVEIAVTGTITANR